MRKPLKDLAAICAGQGAPQGDHNYCENGTPFVKAGNLQELLEGKAITSIQKVSDEVAKKHKLRLYPKGTILFAKSGMSCIKGYIYVLPQSAYVVSHLACITPNEDISEYLRYYFNYHKPNHLVKDAAYPSISLSDVGNLVVDMKPESERNEIVSVLQHTESIITLRQQQLQKLNELVKARFVELFGDPVRNSMGLKTMPLGKACCLKAGITTSADMIHEQSNKFSIPCYGGNGIRGYVELATQCGCYPIIGRQGALCGNVQLATGKFHATEHAVLVTPLIETNVIWLFYLLKMMDLYRFHTGAAQPGLAVKTLNTVDIPIADVAAQHQFAAFVTQTDKSKVAIQKALDEAQLLFDSLMQKYFG